MSINNNIKFIIIQAGGKGTRLEHLTYNKPKCLVSIAGKPILFHTFKSFKNAKFLIIADYKKEILKKYLKIFAPDINYQIVNTQETGTCSGINQALKLIPAKTPFVLTWSDLLFFKKPFLRFNKKYNYVGQSHNLTCRWQFYKNKFKEIKSKKNGVAGFFIFKNRNELKNLPMNGEFVQFLKKENIDFKPLKLINTQEIGTLANYFKIQKNYPPVRPFNQIIKTKKFVIKKPLDQQGKKIAVLEKNFYKKFETFNYDFIPKIYKYNPLTLKRINGKSLFLYKNLTNKNKTEILKNIITSLGKIHQSFPAIDANRDNDYKAIINKTFNRLKTIKNLIPNTDSDFFIINQKKCFNVFKNWHLVEKTMDHFYPLKYFPTHGDLTFSNTLYDPIKNKIYIIDPRGYYGDYNLFGDIDYDWAKIYYSLIGNYDQFNIKNFKLEIDKEKINLNITSNNWESLENTFFKLTKADKNKIKFFHSIIWLSLTTYAWDNIDSILGAFYNGSYLLQDFYDKKTF